jgi:hypothetical protein
MSAHRDRAYGGYLLIEGRRAGHSGGSSCAREQTNDALVYFSSVQHRAHIYGLSCHAYNVGDCGVILCGTDRHISRNGRLCRQR